MAFGVGIWVRNFELKRSKIGGANIYGLDR